MTDDFRQLVLETLRKGEDLPADWARFLFPPSKRECELVYYGKDREEDILLETMGVPLQPVATFGRNGGDWHNMLVHGDNLQVMKGLLALKQEGKLLNADGTPGIRLVYIDPPFASKQEFRGSQDQKAYRDKVAGAEFLEFLRKRLVLLRELLSDDGSIYVHVDWKKSHYVRVLLDEVFGENNFVNEIIWYYTNKYGANSEAFDSFHHSLFRYRKSKKTIYQPIRVSVKTAKKQPVRAWNKELAENEWLRDDDGNRLYQESTEKDAGDVWEIPVINPMASERKIDYPTQKPELLLSYVIRSSSREGDLVLDAFSGSGTTCAVAEKLKRRWIAIDCGKLSIYTIQKRLLNLKEEIGDKGRPLTPKPFTLYNAGLYDFSTLRKLPWNDWRFFALRLFGCKDEPHEIGGMKLDGKFRSASVLVFNHLEHPERRIDEETIESIHAKIGRKVGSKFFIVAPRGVFDFQQDYIDLDDVRYYALRIPYSIINELHHRQFTSLKQPSTMAEVNALVDAVGFDFIQPPVVEIKTSIEAPEGQLVEMACLRIAKFESRSQLGQNKGVASLDDLAMLLLDYDFDGHVFGFDAVFSADELKDKGWAAWFPKEGMGETLMAVFVDIHGNESRVTIPRSSFKAPSNSKKSKKSTK